MDQIEVLRSAAGFYIGTTDEDGLPASRISDYFPSPEIAQRAMEHGFTLRRALENVVIIDELLLDNKLAITNLDTLTTVVP